jgi:hypothetical protein
MVWMDIEWYGWSHGVFSFKNKLFWQGFREKGAPTHSWWQYKLVQPLWKSVCRFIKKLKIGLSYDPAIQLLGIYLKECKSTYKRHTCTPTLIAALFTTAKLGSQQQMNG